MRICTFEDHGWHALAPLTLTRPVFDLRCGALSLLQRQQRHFDAEETALWVRPALADWCRLHLAELPVNDSSWLGGGSAVLVNARWLPLERDRGSIATPHAGIVNGELAYAVVPPALLQGIGEAPLDETVIRQLQHALPRHEAGGWMIDRPWDLVEHNAAALRHDHATLEAAGTFEPIRATLVGLREDLHLAASARVEPLAVLDTSAGPIIIEEKVVVQSFSRIEGPCFIGAGSTILGARISGCSIGPCCKIGGEAEASIIQGYSNKAHEGFLGHSYLGEWVNLGAGTQFSDLRNDYHPVTVRIDGQRISTDRLKVGSFVGDFTRTGLNTLFNTGSMVGAFCNLPSSAEYLPRCVPSFTTLRQGQLQEEDDFDNVLTTARVMMNRRGRELTETHRVLYRGLFDHTRSQRDEVLRKDQLRAWRRSV
jgi:UDP-N-acetylglucosamine diphosphorylase/glucosamine-1-phosphate N-acetyltransferase